MIFLSGLESGCHLKCQLCLQPRYWFAVDTEAGLMLENALSTQTDLILKVYFTLDTHHSQSSYTIEYAEVNVLSGSELTQHQETHEKFET